MMSNSLWHRLKEMQVCSSSLVVLLNACNSIVIIFTLSYFRTLMFFFLDAFFFLSQIISVTYEFSFDEMNCVYIWNYNAYWKWLLLILHKYVSHIIKVGSNVEHLKKTHTVSHTVWPIWKFNGQMWFVDTQNFMQFPINGITIIRGINRHIHEHQSNRLLPTNWCRMIHICLT